jgi:hypothetical protein
VEIHKPKPIHSWREFAVELLTIVMGILIALGAEALVEHHRTERAVGFSRADFIDELSRNRGEVAANLEQARVLQGQLNQVLLSGAKFVAGKGPPLGGVQVARDFVWPKSAAWAGALSTKVMGDFPHDEGRAVAKAYSEQEAFIALQRSEQTVWFGLAESSYVGAPTRPEVAKALQHMTEAAAYLQAHIETEQGLLKAYDGALERLKRE